MQRSEGLSTDLFVRAPLHCVPAAKIGLPGAAARKPAAQGTLSSLAYPALTSAARKRASGRAGLTSGRA